MDTNDRVKDDDEDVLEEDEPTQLRRISVPSPQEDPEVKPYSPGPYGVPRLWLTKSALDMPNVTGALHGRSEPHPREEVIRLAQRAAYVRQPRDEIEIEAGAQPLSAGKDGFPRLWLTRTKLQMDKVSANAVPPESVVKPRWRVLARRHGPVVAAFILGAALATLVTYAVMRPDDARIQAAPE